MTIADLPALNASLNAVSATLLVAGFAFIKAKNIAAHKACMIAAFFVSAAFLASYLTYHFNHPMTPFPVSGFWKNVYLLVLVPHIILAVLMLPMILGAFWNAYKERWPAHTRLARWALPIWIYVSITGVLVYVMLYKVQWVAEG